MVSKSMFKYYKGEPPDYIPCQGCDYKIPKELFDKKIWNLGGKFYILCPSCQQMHIHKCTDCGRKFGKQLMTSSVVSMKVWQEYAHINLPNAPWNQAKYGKDHYFHDGSWNPCPKCAAKAAQTCNECGRIYVSQFGLQDGLCHFCLQKKVKCKKCGGTTTEPHPYEENTCMNCQPHIYQVQESSWNFKPNKFAFFRKNKKDPLLYGIEVEINAPGNHGQEAAKWAHLTTVQAKKMGNLFYLKWDGTIKPGFEIVFHPMDWTFMTQEVDWEWLFELEKIRSQTHPQQGIHVHMDRKAFTPFHIFKFSNFIYNNIVFSSFIFERFPNKYCSTDLDIPLSQAVRKDIGCVKVDSGNMSYYNMKRRKLVNHINKNTVELRGFQTHLTPEHFWKNLEFCRALYHFTQTYGLNDIEVEKFADYVASHHDKYEQLDSYIQRGWKSYIPPPGLEEYIPANNIWIPHVYRDKYRHILGEQMKIQFSFNFWPYWEDPWNHAALNILDEDPTVTEPPMEEMPAPSPTPAYTLDFDEEEDEDYEEAYDAEEDY